MKFKVSLHTSATVLTLPLVTVGAAQAQEMDWRPSSRSLRSIRARAILTAVATTARRARLCAWAFCATNVRHWSAAVGQEIGPNDRSDLQAIAGSDCGFNRSTQQTG
jgi:hypothetical protein